MNNLVGGFQKFLITDYLFTASLYILLFAMGFIFAVDREAVTKLKKTGLRVLVVPVLIIVGSIFGGLVAGLALRLDPVGSMAVTAGYGWYTLTGPLLTQMLGTEWGALGFAVNFLRELLTILMINFLVRLDKYAPIAAGGATTMDTTLPVIVRYCGSETLIAAFSSGFVLSMLAPFTVVAIASLF